MKILTERGPQPHQSVKLSQTYKRSFATLVLKKDLEKAKTSSAVEKKYELPDGQVITIGSERFRCPEDRGSLSAAYDWYGWRILYVKQIITP